MAGAGVRVFQPGEVLTASLVNSYLQDQVVARFTSAAARDAAFGGANQPTLEEGRVCYLDSTNELQYYSGTTWVSISQEAIIGNVVAKGDLVVGTAPSTVARLVVGSNGRVLTADSSTETGLAWVVPSVPDESLTGTKLVDGAVTTAKIANDAVALGTKTTGDYVASLVAGTGVTLANNSGESATPTVAIGQAVTTSSEVIFQGITQTSVVERITVSATAATGTIPVDVSNGTTYYTANSTANFVVNLRWNSGTTLNAKLAVGEMATTSFLVTNATAYYATSVQVNGTTSGVTTRWQGATGAPTLGNANSTDMYTFTVIKTAANTFTVFAAQTKFS